MRFLCLLEALYMLKINHGFFVKPVFGPWYFFCRTSRQRLCEKHRFVLECVRFFLMFLEALYILKITHGFFVKPVFGALYAASIFEDRAAYFEDRAAHDVPTRLALFSHSTKFGFPLDLGVCFLC